ncbi:MAG: putative PEP-binding protein [Acidimicrobiales bacterium]
MADDVATRIRAAVERATITGAPADVAAALTAVTPADVAGLFHSEADRGAAAPIGHGLPASPGVAAGEIVLDPGAARLAADAGGSPILVRTATTAVDTAGMEVASALLTTTGGLTSHAAIVARSRGIPAVVGAEAVHIEGDLVRIGDVTLRSGDTITIDGGTGEIHAGRLTIRTPVPPPELATLLGWADQVNDGHVQIRVNADTAAAARKGRALGARGVGLCRTERMSLEPGRLGVMQRFILADDPDVEAATLAEMEATLAADVEALLREVAPDPVAVRLLDPPLHEFLPDLVDLTERDGRGELDDRERAELVAVRRLHEHNPMLGTRGVRVGVIRPGLYEMQIRALCRAAATLDDEGLHPRVEILVPLVFAAEELRLVGGWVDDALDAIGRRELRARVVAVGAMVETLRAAVTSAALAAHADVLSFGTNDLTQMTYALGRDDTEARVLEAYRASGIIDANPFAVLDREGVGALLRVAADGSAGRQPVDRAHGVR